MAEKETKYYSFPPYSPYRDRTTSDKDKNILSGLSHFIDIGSKKSPNVENNTTKTSQFLTLDCLNFLNWEQV